LRGELQVLRAKTKEIERGYAPRLLSAQIRTAVTDRELAAFSAAACGHTGFAAGILGTAPNAYATPTGIVALHFVPFFARTVSLETLMPPVGSPAHEALANPQPFNFSLHSGDEPVSELRASPLDLAARLGRVDFFSELASDTRRLCQLVAVARNRPLFEAIASGHLRVIEILLEAGIEPDVRIAVSDFMSECPPTLLDADAPFVAELMSLHRVIDCNETTCTPLGYALMLRQWDAAERFVIAGASTGEGGYQSSPLFWASFWDETQWVRRILPTVRDECEVAEAAIIAVKRRCTDVLSLILQQRPEQAQRGEEDGVTLLFFAAQACALVPCEMLLKAGANPDGGHVRYSPIHAALQPKPDPSHVAAFSSRRARSSFAGAIVKALLDAGADPNRRDQDEDTPLHLAASSSAFVPVVQLLIERGGKPNAVGHFGRVPLHIAAMRGNEQALECLLRAGADPEVRDESGRRPVDYAHNDRIRELFARR
jgi:ankyrin repeat protein